MAMRLFTVQRVFPIQSFSFVPWKSFRQAMHLTKPSKRPIFWPPHSRFHVLRSTTWRATVPHGLECEAFKPIEYLFTVKVLKNITGRRKMLWIKWDVVGFFQLDHTTFLCKRKFKAKAEGTQEIGSFFFIPPDLNVFLCSESLYGWTEEKNH